MKFQPEPDEVREVKMAGRYLAKQLRDALEDFGGMPARLAPAVVLEALMEAVPMMPVLISRNVREDRKLMKRALIELLNDSE